MYIVKGVILVKDVWWDIFFLNPKTDLVEKICKEIWKNGFIEYGVINGGERKYRKGEAEIYIALRQDDEG